jgi:hypothetical protein
MLSVALRGPVVRHSVHVGYFLEELQQMRLTCFYGANIWGPEPFSYVIVRGAYLAEAYRLAMKARGPIEWAGWPSDMI